MRKRKKYIPYLVVFVISIILLGFYIYVIDPSQAFTFSSQSIPVVIPFFVLLTICVGSLAISLFLNIRRGVLTAIFVDGILLLRYFQLKSILNEIILLLIVILIETFFMYRPRKPKLPKRSKEEHIEVSSRQK